MAENLQTVFLGQGHFEETVSWYERDGAAARPITVCDVTALGQQQAEQHHAATGRMVHFLVTKDPILGTAMPSLGNQIVRSDRTKWGFKRIVSEDAVGWVLEFVGGSIDRAGIGRQAHL